MSLVFHDVLLANQVAIDGLAGLMMYLRVLFSFCNSEGWIC